MRAGTAAAAAGVTIKALRYYESLGLLHPTRLANGYRDYDQTDVRLAAQIRELAEVGFSPSETTPFLDCLREGHELGDDCPESLAGYQAKIDRLDTLITRLTRDRDRLREQLRGAAERGFRSLPHRTEPTPMLPQPDQLPANLPEPVDDGAARHLPGAALPALTFAATDGTEIRLDDVVTGRWVLFVYPLTGQPGVDMPKGWDEIPGARGCSQEACSFRDSLAELRAHGAERVLGLSTDRAEYQQDLVRRLHLPYPLLSDPGLAVRDALGLPTFDAAGATIYRRLTMIVRGNTIEHVFYPVFPPDTHADEVVAWLAAN